MAELTSQPTSIQSAYNLFCEDKLFVNRRYQRKLVWTLEEKQKLVESILKKYPIPAILIAERDGTPGAYEIIDGLQRLQAIMAFIQNSFPTLEGNFFDVTLFPTAKTQSDRGVFTASTSPDLLQPRDVSTFLDYTLGISVMRNASEEEINDVFDRINTYGRRLSDQERRQSGVQNQFSSLVREFACSLRGDVSLEILPLKSMPEISIDLPMAKHGYQVKSEEVFWVIHGILRSTDLRDSLDEQCIADIAACIVGGSLIERSKDALDKIYEQSSDESDRINTALEVYGTGKLTEELKYCIDELLKICASGTPAKLRNILFSAGGTNPFPSVFAVLLIAIHESIIKDELIISDYPGVKSSIVNLSNRIETGRKATSTSERRKNIDAVKGLISSHFIKRNTSTQIYGNHTCIDIESVIRRSEIELPNYELKQGILDLGATRSIDEALLEKIGTTICAMANNGKASTGKIILGVTDKPADSARVQHLDGIIPRPIGRRHVVGIQREADKLGITTEEYFTKIKDFIKTSLISEPLRSSVLSKIDYNDFYGLGIVVLTVQGQNELSYYNDHVYWRSADSTELATTAKKIAELAKRF